MYNISNLPNELSKPLEILANRYGVSISEQGRKITAIKVDEDNLDINATKESITIKHKTTPAFLRAMCIIFQKESKNVMEYNNSSKVCFKFNGLMLDCSRNGVAKVWYVKEIIEQLAGMGHNVLMLYMEDTYKLDSEEYFGYLRGAYSKAELKEIDDYAHMFGIELIPCIQTLAHLEQFLTWSYGQGKYVDIDNILNVGDDKVKDLLDRIIKELSSTVRSRRIHIGMDEAYNLGRGSYADKHGLRNKSEIMKDHLSFMKSVCEKYGVKPIIWDDMFFSGYSRANAENFKIPDGIDLMYWDYYNNNVSHYENNFNIRNSITDKKIMFAGGSWIWIGYASHHGKTIVATNAALTACKNKGVEEVLVTAWADDGMECPISSILFGCALFAEHQYNEKVDLSAFKEMLQFLTKMDYENYMKQQAFDIIPDIEDETSTVTPSKYMLYEDPLCSLFVNHIEPIKADLTVYYNELSSYFMQKANECTDHVLRATNEFYASFGKVLSLKWNLGANIYKAYNNKDMNALKNIADNQITQLIPLVEEMKYARLNEWYLTKKSIGFEVLDARFGAIINRLYTTKYVLNQYINGELPNIDELDEVRLDIGDKDANQKNNYIVHYNRASRASTANKVVW